MKLFRALVLLCAGFALFGAAAVYGEILPVPRLEDRVTDQIGLLSAEQKRNVISKLAAIESRHGAQVAVLIVNTTGEEPLEEFSIRIASAWKLGRKGVDDGVLFLIAKDDRAVRIETGYGLEGALSDVVSKRIIEEYVLPKFRGGEFYEGIDAGVSKIGDVIGGETLPELPSPLDVDRLFFIFIAALAGGSIASLIAGRLRGSALSALVAGTWVFFLTSLPLALLFGLAVFVFVYGQLNSGHRTARGSSGGGGFSGGFSGGGGSFGGGGASGRW